MEYNSNHMANRNTYISKMISKKKIRRVWAKQKNTILVSNLRANNEVQWRELLYDAHN